MSHGKMCCHRPVDFLHPPNLPGGLATVTLDQSPTCAWARGSQALGCISHGCGNADSRALPPQILTEGLIDGAREWTLATRVLGDSVAVCPRATLWEMLPHLGRTWEHVQVGSPLQGRQKIQQALSRC